MKRRPTTRLTQGAVLSTEEPTKPAAVAQGRGVSLSLESAQAIADASQASGFPIPPQALAVLAAADPAAPEISAPADTTKDA